MMDSTESPNVRAARERFEASFARITKQVEGNRALEKERIKALEWCRANGNPHLKANEAQGLTRNRDALLARKAAGFEPRSGSSPAIAQNGDD
jgi:hypothetical protein